MEVRPRVIRYYATKDGHIPFQEWYSQLKDMDAKVAVQTRLARLRLGLFGDSQFLGDGVHELRIFIGPGYRVYFGLKNETLVILLTGGDKSSQAGDIQTAKAYWNDFLRRS